jgi:hypothetical protein
MRSLLGAVLAGQPLQSFPRLIGEPCAGSVNGIAWLSTGLRASEHGADQPDLSMISDTPCTDQVVEPHADPVAEGHRPIHGIRKEADHLAAGGSISDQPVLKPDGSHGQVVGLPYQ